ncbi:MAG TPA: phosphate ABC transporter permease subunit PstC [Caldilineaceae bacterium]|nr:phosphate ABC transporter permease subunit PstC [Caldilineaceae bacterium]
MQSEISIANQRGKPAIERTTRINLQKQQRMGESLIQGFLFLCGAISILTTIGIVFVLGRESLLFFMDPEVSGQSILLSPEAGAEALSQGSLLSVCVTHPGPCVQQMGASLATFFGGVTWQPRIFQFGIWPLVAATLLTSMIAMLVALPLGLMSAIYLSEYASDRVRSTLKPILEVLAGIPTVVYGYFALTFMTPVLRSIFGSGIVEIYNTASAGIVMGILILPLVASMAEDALSAVPSSLRQAAYGVGATKLETAVHIVVPAALSGITAAFVVAISRAVGETMIVAIAAGAGPHNFSSWGDALKGLAILNPFKGAETMTGHIVRISGGDISYGTLDYTSLFSIGLLLFLMTLGLNIISRILVERFREEYE